MRKVRGEERGAGEDREAQRAAPAELHPQEVAERDRAQPHDMARQAEVAHRGEQQEERLRPVAQAPVGGGDQAAQREVGEQDRRDAHELGESRGAARAQAGPGGVERSDWRARRVRRGRRGRTLRGTWSRPILHGARYGRRKAGR